MGQSETSGRRVAAAETERGAIALRKAGLSYEAIGQQLGISRGGAHKAVRRALERIVAESDEGAEELRAVELARLDLALAAIAPEVKAGNLGAVDRWVRVIERRCRLLGLDAPVRQEVAVHEAIEFDWDRAIGRLAPRPTGDLEPSRNGEGA